MKIKKYSKAPPSNYMYVNILYNMIDIYIIYLVIMVCDYGMILIAYELRKKDGTWQRDILK